MFRTRFHWQDAVAALGVVFLACAIQLLPLLWRQEGETLVISTPEGRTEYSLSEDRTIKLTSRGVTLVVVIRDGAAYVKSSTCPDGVCSASGKISRDGESIVCAPAGVRVWVEGGESHVDFVAG